MRRLAPYLRPCQLSSHQGGIQTRLGLSVCTMPSIFDIFSYLATLSALLGSRRKRCSGSPEATPELRRPDDAGPGPLTGRVDSDSAQHTASDYESSFESRNSYGGDGNYCFLKDFK